MEAGDKREQFVAWTDGFRVHTGKRTANPASAAAHKAMQELTFFCARKEFEHIPSVLAALRPDWRFRPDSEDQVHYEAALDIAEIAYGQLNTGRTLPTFEEMWEYWQSRHAEHQERERARLEFLANHDAEVEAAQAVLRATVVEDEALRPLLANHDTFKELLNEPVRGPVPEMPGLYPFIERS